MVESILMNFFEQLEKEGDARNELEAKHWNEIKKTYGVFEMYLLV